MIEDRPLHLFQSSSSSPVHNETSFALTLPEWVTLVILLTLAIIVRLTLFNGPFGSDDLVYLDRAVQISEGIWSSANYNGALRYGFNIPAGFFIYLFGVNLVAVNLWPLLCSLAEIATIYWFALCVWNRQAALYSTLILVCMPLHIAVSTRIHADPVVSFFLTLSFVLFFVAERRRSSLLYFLTGIAMGLVFWAKELAVVTLFAFAFYPFLFRRLDIRWVYLVGGGVVMLFAHFVLMTAIAGDPLHLFKVVTGQVERSFIGADQGENPAWYYFWYLFVDIKHTWLAPFLAAVAVIAVVRQRLLSFHIDIGAAYVTFWLVSLLMVLSFTPISVDPVRLVQKQSNYLTLFLAPIALLAGYQTARLPQRIAFTVLMAIVAGGLVLGALEQQAYHVFTSNSKAAVEFAKAHPASWIVGSVNNGNIARVYSILERDPTLADRFGYLSKVPLPKEAEAPDAGAATKGYAVLDWETMGWGNNPPLSPGKLPTCWKKVTTLEPIGFGNGKRILALIHSAVAFIPGSLGVKLSDYVDSLLRPKPALVYAIPNDCQFTL